MEDILQVALLERAQAYTWAFLLWSLYIVYTGREKEINHKAVLPQCTWERVQWWKTHELADELRLGSE